MPIPDILLSLYDNLLIYQSNLFFVVVPLIGLILSVLLVIVVFFIIKFVINIILFIIFYVIIYLSKEAKIEYSKKELRKKFIIKSYKNHRKIIMSKYNFITRVIHTITKKIAKEIFIEEKKL